MLYILYILSIVAISYTASSRVFWHILVLKLRSDFDWQVYFGLCQSYNETNVDKKELISN